MLGRLFSLRRIIYLGFAFFVSFTIMYAVWTGFPQKYTLSKREVVDPESLKDPTLDDFVSDFGRNNSFVEFILKETTYSGIGPLLEKSYNSIQRVGTSRPSVDYGKDRDLDVEGVADYVLWYENFRKDPPQLPVIARQQRCSQPVVNIAFLKTHYTGSDVITNMLNRYGDLHNLRVALPNDGLSTFYWPMRFQWKYIDITLLNGSLPNIISNHARYNGDVMDNIMSPGTLYISLLRNPVRQLETTFNNLGFAELLGIYNTSDTLETFLIDPKSYIRGVIKRKRFKDSLNLIKNAMFFDLGLSTTEYHKKNIIKATIHELYEKFSVIMIYEYLDESLILLKRRLCWEIDDILYFKFHHSVHNIWNREEFTPELWEMIRIWNSADTALYDYFNKTLWEEIAFEGEDFWTDLKQFREKLKQIQFDCIGEDIIEEGSSIGVTNAGTNVADDVTTVRLNPQVSVWNKYFCEKLLMNEMEYLEYFRKTDLLSKGRLKR